VLEEESDAYSEHHAEDAASYLRSWNGANIGQCGPHHSRKNNDLPVKAQVYKAPPPVAVFNWTGCYVGGQIGGQWANWTADVNYPSAVPTVASRDFSGNGSFIGGGQVGCNYEWTGTHIVIGIEGDGVWANEKFSGEIFRYPNSIDHFDADGKIGGQGSVRARLGYTWHRLMVYAAGGVTWAKLTATHYLVRDGVGAAAFEESKTRSGWNVGGGVEWAFTPNWTVGVEYRYTDYGSFDYTIPAGTFSGVSFIAHSRSILRNIGRAPTLPTQGWGS